MSHIVELDTLNYRALPDERQQDIRDWMTALDQSLDWIFKIETEIIDAPIVRIWRYARGTDGLAMIDPDDPDQILTDVVEILQRVPPPEWWGRWVTVNIRWPL